MIFKDFSKRACLGHLLPVGLRIQRSLSQENRVFLRGHTELIVESVVPDLSKKYCICHYIWRNTVYFQFTRCGHIYRSADFHGQKVPIVPKSMFTVIEYFL